MEKKLWEIAFLTALNLEGVSKQDAYKQLEVARPFMEKAFKVERNWLLEEIMENIPRCDCKSSYETLEYLKKLAK